MSRLKMSAEEARRLSLDGLGSWVVIDPNGRISAAVSGRRSRIEAALKAGQVLVPGSGHPDTHYYHSGEVIERPKCPHVVSTPILSADDDWLVAITGLPEGTAVQVVAQGKSTAVTVDDGTLELTLLPKEYHTLVIEPPFPYQTPEPEKIYAP